jgi:hypothetical protein
LYFHIYFYFGKLNFHYLFCSYLLRFFYFLLFVVNLYFYMYIVQIKYYYFPMNFFPPLFIFYGFSLNLFNQMILILNNLCSYFDFVYIFLYYDLSLYYLATDFYNLYYKYFLFNCLCFIFFYFLKIYI